MAAKLGPCGVLVNIAARPTRATLAAADKAADRPRKPAVESDAVVGARCVPRTPGMANLRSRPTRPTRLLSRTESALYGHLAALPEIAFRDRRSLWLTHVGVRGSQGAPALRARTSRHRGLPSPPRPRAVKGTVVTVNPDAARSLRTAGSGQVR